MDNEKKPSNKGINKQNKEWRKKDMIKDGESDNVERKKTRNGETNNQNKKKSKGSII
jgi:hypothetical protein